MQQNIISNFFRPINTDIQIPDSEYAKTDVCIVMADALARNTNHSLYIIDYHRKNFLYVSSNPLFLCGHSPEEVQQKGYAFYFEVSYLPAFFPKFPERTTTSRSTENTTMIPITRR